MQGWKHSLQCHLMTLTFISENHRNKILRSLDTTRLLIGFEPILVGTKFQRFIQLSYKLKLKINMIHQNTIPNVSDNSEVKTFRFLIS